MNQSEVVAKTFSWWHVRAKWRDQITIRFGFAFDQLEHTSEQTNEVHHSLISLKYSCIDCFYVTFGDHLDVPRQCKLCLLSGIPASTCLFKARENVHSKGQTSDKIRAKKGRNCLLLLQIIKKISVFGMKPSATSLFTKGKIGP